MAWACPSCTFLNQGGRGVCGMCALDSPESVVDSGPEWSCSSCTFLNPFVESSCEMCNTARPELTKLESKLSSKQDLRSIGKFRPLRINVDKDTIRVDAESNSEFRKCPSLAKGSDVTSRKRKAIDLDDEECVSTNDMDGALKEKTVIAGGLSNSLLGELHLQRIARMNNSMASSDRESASQQNLVQASGLTSEAQRTSKSSQGPCSPVHTDTILVLTYNVWFRDDICLEARMNAIGKIIELHRPHVICLQEVTSAIYDIFQSSSWWSLYKCSVSPDVASRRSYFCMQLSSLPVSAFHRNPYSNSIMGRELAMADLDYGDQQQIVVATTHLESPCPAPPSWNQMYSKERVYQAKEALKLMRDLPNVIFGGDMNWDDKQDGPPPLPPGWFDAWLRFKPNQPGLTYDSKANPMLGGGRLQKRLDRFFCHLQDFEVRSIEMVGTQPIKGFSYEKESKVKGRVQVATLPVLPSDHFGVLLKLQKICT